MYPTISADTLSKSIQWASTYAGITISKEEEELIYHSRESILFCQRKEYEKRTNPIFEVTEGSYEGAEIAELIWLMILDKIVNKKQILEGKQIGIYRDDCLIATDMCTREQDANAISVEMSY